MKKIKLTQGLFAIIDDADFKRVSKHKWCAMRPYPKFPNKVYAVCGIRKPDGTKTTLSMHRFIMGRPKGKQVDHKNDNTLDNRRENLRKATASENACNRGKQKNNTSGFKGVFQSGKKWTAQIRKDNRLVYLGTFSTSREAAAAYNKNAIKAHGDFARVNNIK